MRIPPILLIFVALPACDGAEPARDGPEVPQDAARSDAVADSAIADSAVADAAPDMGPFDCAEAWANPRLTTTETTRPATPALGLTFDYGLTGGAHITLTEVAEGQVVQPSDGPFSVQTHAGAWVELQDAGGVTRYTRGVFELIGESLEVPPGPGDGGFSRVERCPDVGSIRLSNLPNDPAATQVVLFQEALDGQSGGPTIELARFALP
jgi:hypothetical protein